MSSKEQDLASTVKEKIYQKSAELTFLSDRRDILDVLNRCILWHSKIVAHEIVIMYQHFGVHVYFEGALQFLLGLILSRQCDTR